MLAWVQMLENGTCCNIRTFSNQGWRYEDVVVINVDTGEVCKLCDIVTQAYQTLPDTTETFLQIVALASPRAVRNTEWTIRLTYCS